MKQIFDGEISILVSIAVDVNEATSGKNKLQTLKTKKIENAIEELLKQNGIPKKDIHVCEVQFIDGEYGEPVL